MPEDHGADTEAPDETGPAGEQEHEHAEGDTRHVLVPVEPHQLRVGGHVLDDLVRGLLVPWAHDPSNVCPQEPAKRRRVDVFLDVREAVVVPMMARPPERPLLNARLGPERHQELERPRRLERPVGEVPVVGERDPQDPDPVGDDTQHQRLGRHGHEDRPDDGQNVERQIGPGADPVDPLPVGLGQALQPGRFYGRNPVRDGIGIGGHVLHVGAG